MIPITHHQNEQCFIASPAEQPLSDAEQAVLRYRLSTPDDGQPLHIDFHHTYVPPAFRGKGYAEALVGAGLQWARQQGYEITASCWYVQKFL